MCDVLQVSKSGYYCWLNSSPGKRKQENLELLEHIRKIYHKSRQTYGSPRITKDLWAENIHVSRPRVARLMKMANIRSKIAKKYVVTTDSQHKYPVVSNYLDRNFHPAELAKVWVSDITYIRTQQGWLYLTVILDLGDRKVIGWSISQGLTARQTSIPAWKMSIKKRPITRDDFSL